MPRPSAWGHLTTGLSPVSENNSWHSSLISNVWLSKPFLWHLWHQPVPWRKLTSLARMLCHTLIFHNSRAHNHWSQRGKVLGKGAHCRLTVSSEGKEWEASSLFLCFFSGQWCHPGRLHLPCLWPPRRLYLPMPSSWRLEVLKPSAHSADLVPTCAGCVFQIPVSLPLHSLCTLLI